MLDKIRIAMFGDIVGIPGKALLQKHLPLVKRDFKVDAVIVNGENCATDGRGITTKDMEFFKLIGVDVITTGNHVWQKKDIYSYIASHTDLVRPANFPSDCPGKGITTFTCQSVTIGVLNIQGRVFMRELLSCPFRAADSALTFLKSRTNIVLVDFHAETTSEKLAMAYYLDGRVSALVGTHTHVPTADARVLPKGTAYVTDLGMAGALDSLIGMKKEPIITQMLTQMPARFEVETTGPMRLSGVVVTISVATGLAEKIEQFIITDTDIVVSDPT